MNPFYFITPLFNQKGSPGQERQQNNYKVLAIIVHEKNLKLQNPEMSQGTFINIQNIYSQIYLLPNHLKFL